MITTSMTGGFSRTVHALVGLPVGQGRKGKMQAVPIFEKDGNRLFVLAESFLGQSEEEARQIGIGASLVEAVLMGMRYTGDVMPIDAPDGKFTMPHVRATLAGTTCCVIAGPLFDEANKEMNTIVDSIKEGE